MPSSLQVFDIKRFSTHDGLGIRTTVFLKGCPLRCRWCQNPEGLSVKPQVLYMENKCIHCFSCVHASKHQGIEIEQGHVKVHRQASEDWEMVIDACPTRALQMDSQTYTIKELVEEIKKDEAFFQREGGVTISGGEPFLQPEGLIALLQACKQEKIHTAIETSLYTDLKWVQKALPFLDQIYADCKLFDPVSHQRYTGVDNQKIQENIRYLLESDQKENLIIRTPLIPQMTATQQNIAQIASFISSIYKDVKYEILNYNPLAKSKYAYLDMEYCFKENPKLYPASVMEKFYDVARKNGVRHLVIE